MNKWMKLQGDKLDLTSEKPHSTNRTGNELDLPHKTVSTLPLDIFKQRLKDGFHLINARTGTEIFVKLHQHTTPQCLNIVNFTE